MVWDYAVRPDGEMVVFSELTEEMGTNLWQAPTGGNEPSILMACSPAACSGPVGQLTARLGSGQRYGTEQNGGITDPPRPWMMHVESGETATLLIDDQELGFDLRWSSDGQWVAYVSPVQGQLSLVNLVDGSRRSFDSGTGEVAAWHPRQPRFLFTRITQVGDAYAPHLILGQVDAEETIDISGADNLFEDRTRPGRRTANSSRCGARW